MAIKKIDSQWFISNKELGDFLKVDEVVLGRFGIFIRAKPKRIKELQKLI